MTPPNYKMPIPKMETDSIMQSLMVGLFILVSVMFLYVANEDAPSPNVSIGTWW